MMMKKTMLLLFAVSSLWAFSYAEPDTLILLAQGSSPNQVGLSFEDVPVGPYRLTCAGSNLYLLDQLNSRVLRYDTTGSFVQEIKIPFNAWDMTVDESGALYFLDNRTQPARIAIIKDGVEVERLSIPYDVKHPLTAVVAHPGDSLLAVSGTDFYAIVREDPMSTSRAAATLTILDPDSIAGLEVSGIRFLGLPHPPEQRVQRYLLAYGSGRVWMGKETMIQDKSGSFYLRDILVLSDSDEEPAFISLPDNFYCYDTGWRNVAIDQFGNVYAFTSTEEGEEGRAAILRWRAVY